MVGIFRELKDDWTQYGRLDSPVSFTGRHIGVLVEVFASSWMLLTPISDGPILLRQSCEILISVGWRFVQREGLLLRLQMENTLFRHRTLSFFIQQIIITEILLR